MKKIISILTFALAIMMVSCTKEGEGVVNQIDDHYVAPANVAVLSTLSKSESTWSTDRRYFDLSFTGEGVSVATTLVGYDALLTPGQYLLGADEIGKAIAAKTKLNDKAVEAGWITVTKKGNDYIFSFSLDGEVLSWTGALPFVADPAPVELTDVLSAQSNLANGVKTLTMNLAQTGLHQEMDPTTYQQTWVGEGKYLALDIYSEDGYLHEGNYMACEVGGTVGEGEFGIGYDTDLDFGWGPMHFENWGTCLWTVSGGVATAEKILDGLVAVSSEKVDDVVIWSISWGVQYPVEVLFKGAIPALTKPEVAAEFDYTYVLGEPTDCVLSDYSVVAGVKKNPVTIMDVDGQTVAYLEFVLADGSTEFEGSFVSTEYAHEVGQLANGYFLDYSAYGYGIIEGGSYYIDADGNKVYIAPGKVVDVTKLVQGAYEFVGEGFDIKACGEGYVPGSYNPDGGDYTEFVEFLGTSSYVGYGVNLAGFNIATEGVATGGDGLYLKIEYYCTTTDGLPVPGVYNACAEGGAVGEGEFGIGYDGMFGASGTTLYTVSGGQYPYEYITDGKLTITADGSDYDVILDCSLIKAHYHGPINPAG